MAQAQTQTFSKANATARLGEIARDAALARTWDSNAGCLLLKKAMQEEERRNAMKLITSMSLSLGVIAVLVSISVVAVAGPPLPQPQPKPFPPGPHPKPQPILLKTPVFILYPITSIAVPIETPVGGQQPEPAVPEPEMPVEQPVEEAAEQPQTGDEPPWWGPLAEPGSWSWIGELGKSKQGTQDTQYPSYPATGYQEYIDQSPSAGQPAYPSSPGSQEYPGSSQPMPGQTWAEQPAAQEQASEQEWPAQPSEPEELPSNVLGEPISLENPAKNGVTVRCLVNGKVVELGPGRAASLAAGKQWLIEFHRGGDFGTAKYKMSRGTYTFMKTDHGWELYRTSPEIQEPPAAKEAAWPPENPLP